MNGKCPRCSAPITAVPDERGLVQCGGCGVWLRSAVPAAAAAPPPPPPPSPPPPSPPPPPAEPEPATAPLNLDPPTPAGPDLDTLRGDIRDLRRMQAEILQLQAQILSALRSWPTRTGAQPESPGAATRADDDEIPVTAAPPLPRVRQRRKTVLVIDDDARTLDAAVAALEAAQVPVRGAASGHAGISAIAASKPDVVVLELDLGEPMTGRDFVNTLKATMEWVDIRLVLHTRLAITSAQEARVQHGADDFVLKGPGSDEALVNHVIALFQTR